MQGFQHFLLIQMKKVECAGSAPSVFVNRAVHSEESLHQFYLSTQICVSNGIFSKKYPK